MRSNTIRIAPKVQADVFDVARWEQDQEFGVFPQGARAKDAVFAPAPAPDSVLIGGKRYLFKRSKRSYPDQFWGEVIAYRIGCLLGLEVPPAFAAWNSETGHCGALIEWFYVEHAERFVMGGDFLQLVQPNYDRDVGTMHNMALIDRVMRALGRIGTRVPMWRQWWVDALAFDALIGNTDRHQDNWCVIFRQRTGIRDACRMGPLFDNGTSLGHERFLNKVQSWSDAELNRYIARGTHHVKWSLLDQPAINGHTALLRRAALAWPDIIEPARKRLDFSQAELAACCDDLMNLQLTIPLEAGRMAFMQRLLRRRRQLVIDTLDECLALAQHR